MVQDGSETVGGVHPRVVGKLSALDQAEDDGIF